MKQITLYLFLISICSLAFGAAPKTVDDLVGRTFSVEDHWAGQELAFKKEHEAIIAIWRIRGSGVPIISEKTYPVAIKSPRQCRFLLQVGDHVSEVIVNLDADHGIKVYLEGIRIYVSED